MNEEKEVVFTAVHVLAYSRKTGKVFKDETRTIDNTISTANISNTVIGEVIRAEADLDLNDLCVVVRPF